MSVNSDCCSSNTPLHHFPEDLAFLVVLAAVTAAAAGKGWQFFKALLTTR